MKIHSQLFTTSIKKLLNKPFAVLLYCILMSGCGFSLRGDYFIAAQLQHINVTSVDKYGELTRIVKQHLLLNKVEITKSYDKTLPELNILKDTLNRRTLSVFPNGQVAEYELIYTVRYQLRFANEDFESFKIELNRDYQDDPDLALAKSRELALMLSEMRQEAANKIIRNLASIQR
ncbi:LPS-assembly lipoprotein LptE [Thalassotalea profundi]|uniref:LPS-assembly lipoprotein LptE n=1 Tax=Thalassotalea profundi TaxID=2036687 RepID=A0ABQ3IH01_9GAMM|nr:LPS assembly lipoprotein LptE [Thalassotalea profundi]GHE80056.1 LPS-assembly lipoprotein LptE [Thalassotalea profundi]